MNAQQQTIAIECSKASEEDRMSFPEVIGRLSEAGIEGYSADLLRSVKVYYLPDGSTLDVASFEVSSPVAAAFDAGGVEAAVRKAQAGGPAYSYAGFCREVMAAGCMGYLVSILGRRVVYFGRTAETHVEHFPQR